MRYDQPFGRGCPVVFNGDARTHERRYADDTANHPGDYCELDTARQRDDLCRENIRENPEKQNGGKPAGMVYHAPHGLKWLYDPARAIAAGTLFDELNLPMEDCKTDTRPCITSQQAIAFAAWEMRLYLCTHPKDRQALELYRQMCRQAEDPNYACTFAPCTAGKGTWDWVDDPWPWEYAAHCDRRG